MVRFCGCKHGPNGPNPQGAQFQDQKYGPGVRVHTVREAGKEGGGHFCTICGQNNKGKAAKS